MNGMCSSGRRTDCQNQYSHEMICCNFENVDIDTSGDAFQIKAPKYGYDIECPPGFVVDGFCASGNNADCVAEDGTSVFHFINCRPYAAEN